MRGPTKNGKKRYINDDGSMSSKRSGLKVSGSSKISGDLKKITMTREIQSANRHQ